MVNTVNIMEYQDNCCICCDNNDNNFVITTCNHKMHSKCLKSWLDCNRSCPLCKTTLNPNDFGFKCKNEYTDMYKINNINFKGESALSIAVNNNNLECIKILLEMGADINNMNEEGQSTISIAIANNNQESVKLLYNTKSKIYQNYMEHEEINNANSQMDILI